MSDGVFLHDQVRVGATGREFFSKLSTWWIFGGEWVGGRSVSVVQDEEGVWCGGVNVFISFHRINHIE